MTITLDGITVDIIEEDGAVRVTVESGENAIFDNLAVTFVENVLKANFQFVKTYYESKACIYIAEQDISIISMHIVLHYLYMYNMWRETEVGEEDRDLAFLEEDFDDPQTHDMIIYYFRSKYPDSYSAICELLLGMSAGEFKNYEKRRQEQSNR